MYAIRSKTGEEFTVDKNVVDASTLLKNICEFTAVTEPIEIDCSSFYLKKFITIVNNYDYSTKKVNDEFKEFVDDVEMLVEMVTDLSILDSDILLDFAADIILEKLEHITGSFFKERCLWKKLKNFFEFEDEFLEEERKIIEEIFFDFFLSMDFEGMKFPFAGVPAFHSLKNKFYTPMNVLLARIIQRSDSEIAFEFSMINKTLKNENDRYPLKPSEFAAGKSWDIRIRDIYYTIPPGKSNEKYFNCIKQRKVSIFNDKARVLLNGAVVEAEEDVKRISSLDFIIPKNDSILQFHTKIMDENLLYLFDMEKCPFNFIHFQVTTQYFGFDKFYENIIAKGFSKKIQIHANPFFNIFEQETVEIRKHSGATKFCEINILSLNRSQPNSKFKEFILNYMDENGTISAKYRLFSRIQEISVDGKFYCTYSQAIEGFKTMVLTQ